jgi:hypothetical protein
MTAELMGYCDLHGREVFDGEFEDKGCWDCWHFNWGGIYLDIYDAAELLGKSQSTIRRWARNGRLGSRTFYRGRPEWKNPQKTLITRESVEEILNKRS